MQSSDIHEIINEIRAGHMVVMVDDEFRENEGDLLIAAEKITPDAINFMATYGRGLICLTLTAEGCKRLRLPLMVSSTDNRLATNFTLSIEAREGVTTGISAKDRAHTIRVAVNPESGPNDIVSPGHIFPLMAQPGGVLTRAGHTETGCDLARMAGLEPAAVIVEILNEDGTMARRPDLEDFANRHRLKIGTIRDLIQYRVRHERTVHPIRQLKVTTRHGQFLLHAYRDDVHRTTHLALTQTQGTIRHDKSIPVRVHIENSLTDTVGVLSDQLSWPLDKAMAHIAREGEGVIVILRLPEKYRALEEQIRALEKVPPPRDKKESGGTNDHYWTLGVGAQILKDLGVGRMRLMSTPKYFHGLSGFDLSIDEYLNGAP